jgi:hypothetical protein
MVEMAPTSVSAQRKEPYKISKEKSQEENADH